MEIKELMELLQKRLYIELQLFKDTLLQQEKEEIYNSSYKIEAFADIYEILLGSLGQLDEGILRGFLHQESGILENFYQGWLTREDCIFDELKAYVGSELGEAAKAEKPDERKEDTDGTGIHQAA